MQAEYPDVTFNGPPGAYSETSYPKRYIAIHNTSNTATDTAESNYAESRPDHVSSHYYVDADSITQSLRTEFGANHAGSTIGNRHAIAYEITGTNSKTRTWWLSNVDWSDLARQIARDCRKHGITPRLLTIPQMLDGKTTGIVTHDQMRQAWGGTTHTDPGPGFPLDHLLALVQAQLSGDGDDDMTPSEQYKLHALNERMADLVGGKETVDVPAFTASDGSKFPALTSTNQTAINVRNAAADARAAKEGVVALNAKIGAIAAVDPVAVAAALAGNADFAAALATAVADRIGGREAAADRARADVLDG